MFLGKVKANILYIYIVYISVSQEAFCRSTEKSKEVLFSLKVT